MTMIFAAYDFYEALKWGFNNKMVGSNDPNLSNKIFTLVGYTLNGTVAGLMTVFLKFHLKLATENKTTIENLDKINGFDQIWGMTRFPFGMTRFGWEHDVPTKVPMEV